MKHIIQNKHWEINKDYNIIKLLYLLIDRPNEITIVDLLWENNKGKVYRKYDLPAMIYINGFISWNINNELNRENNKPAYISNNGLKQYFVHGNFIKEET